MCALPVNTFVPTDDVICSICRNEWNMISKGEQGELLRDFWAGIEEDQFVKTVCGHIFCAKCWEKHEEDTEIRGVQLKCPYCRTQLDNLQEYNIGILTYIKLSEIERSVIWFNTHVSDDLRSTPDAENLKQRIIQLIENGEKLHDILCPPQGSMVNDLSHVCYDPIVIKTYYEFMWDEQYHHLVPSPKQLQFNDAMVHKKLPDDTQCSKSGERIGHAVKYSTCHNCNAHYCWQNIFSEFVAKFNKDTNTYQADARSRCRVCKEVLYFIHRESTKFGKQYNEAYKNWKDKERIAEILISKPLEASSKFQTRRARDAAKHAYNKFNELDKLSRLNSRKAGEELVGNPTKTMQTAGSDATHQGIKFDEKLWVKGYVDKCMQSTSLSAQLVFPCNRPSTRNKERSIYYHTEIISIDDPCFINTQDVPSRYGYASTIPLNSLTNILHHNIRTEAGIYNCLTEQGISWFPIPDTVQISTTENVAFKPQYLATRDAGFWRGSELNESCVLPPRYYITLNAVGKMNEMLNNLDLNKQTSGGYPIDSGIGEVIQLGSPQWVGKINVDEFTTEGRWGLLMGPAMSSQCPKYAKNLQLSPNKRFLLYVSQPNLDDFSIRPKNCRDCGCHVPSDNPKLNLVCIAVWDKEREWKDILTSMKTTTDYIYPSCNASNKLNLIKNHHIMDDGNTSYEIDFDVLESLADDTDSEFITTHTSNMCHSGYIVQRYHFLTECLKNKLSMAKTDEERKVIKGNIAKIGVSDFKNVLLEPDLVLSQAREMLH